MSEEQNIDSIFCSAIEIESGAERSKYLQRVCGDNSDLYRQVERLIEAHICGGSVLDSPDLQIDATLDQSISERTGSQIGPYKLLQQLGEGGMGVVFMAEQSKPVQRRVALKIIKPGMDSRRVIARFEAERQALAMMDHPNIAKVLDVGQTDSGLPYFAMELVNGVPITQFCDEQHLTARERLELFIPICQAVQHAHQKGIIHRDIKPSNLLVALYDGRPVPKVIDFGVAKATAGRLTEKTMFTSLGQIIGTIEYMSPEQAMRNQLDIDTRSDVYSLGVVLYELLCGDTPFDKRRLRAAAIDELLKIIREEEPLKPSTRLSGSETLPSVAANRSTEPVKLSALVRGELDWIVMKALDKERDRRYETANGFARDIQRYLNDEAVQACPPSTLYRFRKFGSRNKAALTTASILGLALLVTIVGVAGSIGWAVRNRAAIEEQVARERSALSHSNDGRTLLRKGDLSGAVREFRMVTELDPEGAEAFYDLAEALHAQGDVTGAIREYERAIDTTPDNAEYHNRLGRALIDQADLEGAMRAFHTSITLNPEYADAYFNLARAHKLSGDLKEAKRLYQRTIAIDPDHKTAHQNLGLIFKEQGNIENAIRELRTAVEIDPQYALAQRQLGDVFRESGDNAAAIETYRTAIALRIDGGGPHLNLALALEATGDTEGAARELEKAVEFVAESAMDHSNRGLALRQQNDLEGAILAFRKAMEIEPTNADYCNSLGDTQLSMGDVNSAVRTYKTAIEIDPNYYRSRHNLGRALSQQGDLDGAIREFETAIKLNPTYSWSHIELGRTLAQVGRHAEAIGPFTEGISLGANHHRRWIELAQCHRALGNTEEYETCCRAIVECFSKPDDRSISEWGYLGQGLYRVGQFEQARQALEACIELRGDNGPSINGGVRWWYYTMSLHCLGEADLAKKYFTQLDEIISEHPRPSNDIYVRLHAEAAELLGLADHATRDENAADVPSQDEPVVHSEP